jgi:hypothetical protein
MTSAQIARLAAQTGDWTEPLSNGFSGSLLYDDGSIGRVEGLGANGVLTVMAGGSVDQPTVERTIPTGAFIDRDALNASVSIATADAESVQNAEKISSDTDTITPVTIVDE